MLYFSCDPDVLNGSGQKALDIAVFWNHRGAATLLGDGDKDTSIPSTSGNHVNFYCGGHLDRCAHKRKDKAWLGAKFDDNSTQIIIFIELKPVIIWKNTNLEDMKSASLYRFSQRDIAHLNGKILNKVFLGTGPNEPSGTNSDNTDIAWFAVNLSNMNQEEQEGLLTPAKAEVLEPMPGSMHLGRRDSAIFAQARTMLAWQDRYQFCATCGSAAEPGEGGHKMTCKDENCRSKKGEYLHSPRGIVKRNFMHRYACNTSLKFFDLGCFKRDDGVLFCPAWLKTETCTNVILFENVRTAVSP